MTPPGSGIVYQDPPNLDQIPDFGALGKWIAKLQSWCKAAHREIEDLKRHAEELEGERSKLETEVRELRGLDDEMKGVREMVDDIERGIRTYDELKDYLTPPHRP